MNSQAPEILGSLLARVGRGDEAAFRDLYAKTAPKLFAIARRILGDARQAEDVLQDAYLRIWSHAGRFDPALSQPITWMVTILRNLAIDSRRSTSQRISDRGVDLSDALLGSALHQPEADRQTEFSGLRRCLEMLNEEPRTMVLLAYCAGASRQELAAQSGRPVSTIKSILRRGLASLKDCLDDIT